MKPSRPCPGCGLAYDDMRTGHTFRTAQAELRVGGDDPAAWRNLRRAGVLGYWHEYKRALWAYHVGMCSPAQ